MEKPAGQKTERGKGGFLGMIALRLLFFSFFLIAGSPAAAFAGIEGTCRAVLVGNSYEGMEDSVNPLPGASYDLKVMTAALTGLYRPFEIYDTLENASAADLADCLKGLAGKACEEDLTLFYYSGHGLDSGRKAGALVMVSEQKTELLTLSSLKELLDQVPGQILLVLDSCSGGSAVSAGSVDSQQGGFLQALLDTFGGGEVYAGSGEFAGSDYLVLAACQAKKYAYSDLDADYGYGGVMTRFLMEAMGGSSKGTPRRTGAFPADADGDLALSLKECYDYVYPAVLAYTRALAERFPGEYYAQKAVVWPALCDELLFSDQDLSGAEIFIGEAVYDGEPAKPALSVQIHEKRLTEGTDYTVRFENNEDEGEGRAVISAAGDYSGSRAVPFVIRKKTFTLTFETGGLSPAPAAQTVAFDACPQRPDDPAAGGYVFEGWTCQDSGEPFDFSVPLTGDAEAFARWTLLLEQKAQEEEEGQEETEEEIKEEAEKAGEESESKAQGTQTDRILISRAKRNKKRLRLDFKSVRLAQGYDLYAAYLGASFGDQPVTSSKKSPVTLKKLNGKALKNGKCIRYFLLAWRMEDGEKITLAVSRTGYLPGCSQKKLTSVKKISISSKSISLKEGEKKKLGAKAVALEKGKSFCAGVRALRYESSDPEIASVSKKGVVKARKAGSCMVYITAVSGLTGKVTVHVTA